VISEATQTRVEHAEEELSWAGLAVAETLRAAELVILAIGALLICPPLAILAVVVIVPVIAIALVVGAVTAVIALPVFVVRHLHRHRAPHAHARVHRWAQQGRNDATRVGRVLSKLYAKHDGSLAG
jgi:hypothetical protein